MCCCNYRPALAAAALLIALIGCDATGPAGQLDSTGALSLGIPEKIRSVSAVNLNAVTATATVNGERQVMTLSGDRFIATIALEPTDAISVNLSFEELLENGTTIELAQAQRTVQVTGTRQTLTFEESDFNIEFDFDGDGLTNIRERELGTDPTTPTSFRQSRELTLIFTTPDEIPNPQVTQPRVQFGGIPRGVSQSGLTYTSTGFIATLQEVEVEVLLSQQIPQGRVFLARSTQDVAEGFDDLSITLTDSDWDFSRDDDGDGRTNLVEVREGTDPFTPD
jgi:hypothetical protein